MREAALGGGEHPLPSAPKNVETPVYDEALAERRREMSCLARSKDGI